MPFIDKLNYIANTTKSIPSVAVMKFITCGRSQRKAFKRSQIQYEVDSIAQSQREDYLSRHTALQDASPQPAKGRGSSASQLPSD